MNIQIEKIVTLARKDVDYLEEKRNRHNQNRCSNRIEFLNKLQTNDTIDRMICSKVLNILVDKMGMTLNMVSYTLVRVLADSVRERYTNEMNRRGLYLPK